MPMDLYYIPGSVPCNAVRMVGKALNLEFNLIYIDLWTRENIPLEFIKMNPQRTVPTLNDNGFALRESRAILGYLVDKYAKNDTLYPKDLQKRAKVDQQLYFDMGTLYERFGNYFYPQIFAKLPPSPDGVAKMEEAFGFLNTSLEGHKYAAGDNITIADIALVCTVSMYDVIDFDISKYPNVQKWYELTKRTVPGYEIQLEGNEDSEFFKELKRLSLKQK